MYSNQSGILFVAFGSALILPTMALTPFDANLNITVFATTDCSTGTQPHSDLALSYSVMRDPNQNVSSYKLSRDLGPNEQLDWSTPYKSGTAPSGVLYIPLACGTYQQTTSPDSNNIPLSKEICYVLDADATCVNLIDRNCHPTYDTETGKAEICQHT